jgi:hypothetical protein
LNLSNTYLPLALLLCVTAGPAFAIDTSVEEKTCREIGFKPKTEKFATCVLELYERRANADNEAQSVAESEDDKACRKYGYKKGTPGFADCKQRIDMARQDYEQKRRDYELQLARYEEEKRRYDEEVEAAKRRRLGAAMMTYGLGIASGMRPDEAQARALGLPPPQRPTISPELQSYQHRIILPNGNVMNCRQQAGNQNIFCY